MQDAVPVGTGGMAAVLALDAEKVKAVCAEVTAQLGGAEVVEAVNFNDPGQTVIAGSKLAVERPVKRSRRPVPSAPCLCRSPRLSTPA